MIVMRMIMRLMIVGLVILMIVALRRVAAAGIGPAFRIERRFDGDDPRAETLHHLLDDMIAPDTQSLAGNLCRQMTVAEMPGEGAPDAADRCRGFPPAVRAQRRPRPADRPSSTSASPPRNATASFRSRRNSSPRVPVIAMRRRCRSSKLSTTVSAAASTQLPGGRTRVARIMTMLSQLLDFAAADDLDLRRRDLERRGQFTPRL